MPPFDLKTMDKKKLIILAIAGVLGLMAAFLTNNYIRTESDKAIKSLGGMTSGEINQLKARLDGLENQNRGLASAMQQQNELVRQIQTSTVSAAAPSVPVEKPKPPLVVNTPPGKRAVTVVIDKVSAVGGLIAPGDHVDIIVHLSNPPEGLKNLKSTDGSLAVTLFQDIQILAIGDNTEFGRRAEDQLNASSLTITFALNPHEAGLLSFVQQHGTLRLVLRSSVDGEAYVLPSASWKTLSEYVGSAQGKEPGSLKQEEESSAEEKPKIEVFKGGQ